MRGIVVPVVMDNWAHSIVVTMGNWLRSIVVGRDNWVRSIVVAKCQGIPMSAFYKYCQSGDL